MMKNILIGMCILLLIPLASAIDFCEDEVSVEIDCQLITPEIFCDNYTLDIYDESLSIYKSNEPLIQIDGGFYTYTFNEDEGYYLIVLCDNSSRNIVVRQTMRTQLDTIENDMATSAGVEAEHMLTRELIEEVNTSIITHGDLNWESSSEINNTAIANAVWDVNLSKKYPQADNDNYIATLAGEKVLQALRFIIQLLFGG